MLDKPNGSITRYRGEAEDRQRQDQDGEHRHLDLLGLDLLAEIFRRAPDHQAGDEHGDDDEQQHAVEAGADAAEDDLAELHVEHRHQPAERREAVVHGVDGAVRGGRGRRRPERRNWRCRSGPPCLPCCRADRRPSAAKFGLPARLGPVGDQRRLPRNMTDHRGEERPALALVPHHPAEGVGQRRRDQQDGEHSRRLLSGVGFS